MQLAAIVLCLQLNFGVNRDTGAIVLRQLLSVVAIAVAWPATAQVPNTGHVVHLASPDAFRALVTQFIESQPTDSVARIISAVRTADSVYQQALLTSDTTVLKRLLAPGWTMFHSNGYLQTRESFLNEFRESRRSFAQFRRDSVAVQVFGTAAILTAFTTRTHTVNGHLDSSTVRSLVVYERVGGAWRAAMQQNTTVSPVLKEKRS